MAAVVVIVIMMTINDYGVGVLSILVRVYRTGDFQVLVAIQISPRLIFKFPT